MRAEPVAAAAEPFRPRSQADLAPAGTTARIRANLAALRVLRDVQADGRAATRDEQQVLARWSSWGAVAEATFARPEYAWARDELSELLSGEEYAAARTSTFNAHYTDAALVQQVWHALEDLGFTGGQVLEPGSGSGHFIAFAPDGTHVTGVELEPTSAAISRVLYPQAQILTESFADTLAPEGTFDLTVGNVPFGNVTLHDPRHNRGRHSLHNHFLIKALHLTRPGGLVAVITSAYTMDAPTNLGARREMAELADLVGAVRLPTGAHRRAAGTDVVTDLLVLRRREDDREPAELAWDETRQTRLGEHTLHVNGYFLDHPELVLGTLTAGNGPHDAAELVVDGPADASLLLGEALARITLQAKAAGLTYAPPTGRPALPRPVAVVPAADRKPEGYLQTTPDGGFTRVVDGTPQSYRPPSTQAAELRALLGLRDTQMSLLAAEAASNDDTQTVQDLRAELNRRYDAYQRTYGCIERFDWRSRVDKRTGKTVESKHRPGQGGFRNDPFAAYVRALENFDPAEQTATKAEVFFHRVIGRRPALLAADTPADAIAICLDRYGELRLDQVAELLGVDEAAARDALGELVFDEPGSNRVVLAAEYLSGDVRAKLATAQDAALDDPRFHVNVAALTEVIPTDLLPEEIHCRLGGAWVDASYVQQFLRETFEDDTVRVDHPGGADWFVYSDRPETIIATRQWGIPQLPAHEIAEAILRKSKIQIWYEGPNHTRLLDTEATAVAADKARELDERFGEWVWEDPQRAESLARIYNDRFNNWVPRSYDGSYLSLPGLALSFKPRAHQLAAVERIITDRAVGLVHDVGAGKTSEMIIGVMELRRLGFVTKPIVAVPRNVKDQFKTEWLQRYPQAKLLVADADDMAPANRATFIGRAASGDWDAIVMTHGALERVPVSRDVRQAYLDRRVEQLRERIAYAESVDMHRSTVKQMEKQVVAMEERFKLLLDATKDDGVTFDAGGFDYLVIDEAHLFKNLILTTAIQDLVVAGSQRATDLHMKFEWLREQGNRVGVMATATPFANKMLSEMYNWLLFLNPEGLADRGIHSFEQFVATFGIEITALEVDMVGKLGVKTRLNSVVNVPELMRPVLATSDIKTAEDLQLPTPLLAELADGKRLPETVLVPASTEHLELMVELAARVDDVRDKRVDRSVDNMLKIGNDGRYAALDLRLIGRHTGETTKVDTVADRVHEIWAEHADDEFLDVHGQPEARRGALQIVFCDLGTPGPKGGPKFRKDEEGREYRLWTFYEELRTQLADRGIPAETVRFIHQADSDQAKGELFAACNRGQVTVLVGSTSMMGVGTNVQKRAVALHHVDVPWRPADIRQRNGRIQRQGNQYAEIRILSYVTERSVDGYVWQRVQSKAHLLDQMMRGRSGVRVIENPDDMVITAGMIKAAAVGNPLLMEKEELEARLGQLERKHRNYQSSQRAYKHTARSKAQDHTIWTAAADEAEQALARRINTRGDAFRMTLQGQTYTSRPDADAALHDLLATLPAGAGNREVGSIGGFTILAAATNSVTAKRFVTFTLVDVPQGEVVVSATGEEHGRRVAVVTRLENRLYDIERNLASLRQSAARAATEAERAQIRIGAPFAQQEELDTLRARLTEVNAKLREETKGDNRPASTSEPASEIPAVDPTDLEPATITFGPGDPSTEQVLQVALVLAEQHGWVSRREANEHGGTATADLVRDALADGPAGEDLRQQVHDHLTRGIVRRATAARTWARTLTGNSDYQRNLREAAAADRVYSSDLATLVSAIGGYLRHEDEQAVAAQATGSQWQGSEGDGLQVPSARVVSVRSRPTKFGESQTLRMIDPQGNLYTWTTNTAVPVREGDVVTFNGRVKTHALWHERRDTQLSRARVTVIAEAPPQAPTPPAPAPSGPATPANVPAAEIEAPRAEPEAPTASAGTGDATGPARRRAQLDDLAAAARLPRPDTWPEVPVDSELTIDWFGRSADGLPHPPTSSDRHTVQATAADAACDHALQAGAVAGNLTDFTTDFTARLDLYLRQQLESGALESSPFWQDYQQKAPVRDDLLAAAATAAFTTIRDNAHRAGLDITAVTDNRSLHTAVDGDTPSTAGPEPDPPDPDTDWLAAVGDVLDLEALGDEQRGWLRQHVDQLAGDGRLQAAARANAFDGFTDVFPRPWEDLLMDGHDASDLGQAVARWFFALDATDRTRLEHAAARTVYDTINQAADAARARLSDTIDLSVWAQTRSVAVQRTPGYLLDWLRDQIAAAATDLRAERAARIGDVDGFRFIFERALTAAISAGWDEHQLDDVELFRLFAHDEQFAAALHAAAGQAAYVAIRASFAAPQTGPAAVPAERQRVLTRAITDHAARYAGPHAAVQHNPARYVAEAHVPGGAARHEWDWIAYHLATHPDVLQTPPLTAAQLDARNRAERADRDRRVGELLEQAQAALERADPDAALTLVDQAEATDPSGDWTAIRDMIRNGGARDDTPSTGQTPADQARAQQAADEPGRHAEEGDPTAGEQGDPDEAMSAARHAQLVKAITDHAPRYTGRNTRGYVNDPGRYVAEVHVPGGATPAEWDWIAEYIRANPQVLDGPVFSVAEVQDRDRDTAKDLSTRAARAFRRGDHATALALLEEGQILYEQYEPWDRAQRAVRDTQTAAAALEPTREQPIYLLLLDATHDNPPPVSAATNLPATARALAQHLDQPPTEPAGDERKHQQLIAVLTEQLRLDPAVAAEVATRVLELVGRRPGERGAAAAAPTTPPTPPVPPAPAPPAPLTTSAPAVDAAAASRFTGGEPYTSRNRIRGPLQNVKISANQLIRTRGWNTAGTAPAALADTIDRFKAMKVDVTPPRELLATAVQLASQAEDLRKARYHPGVDPVLAMLHELARISGGFAADLVATALKDRRWQRVFDEPAPQLRYAASGEPAADPGPAPPPTGAPGPGETPLFSLDEPAANPARLAFPRPPQAAADPVRAASDVGARVIESRRPRPR